MSQSGCYVPLCCRSAKVGHRGPSRLNDYKLSGGQGGLGSHSQADGRCQRPLACVERDELLNSHRFCGGDMKDIEAARSASGRMLLAQTRSQAESRRPFHRSSHQSAAAQIFLQIGPSCIRVSDRQQFAKDAELEGVSNF